MADIINEDEVYIHDLDVSSILLDSNDKLLIQKNDGSGTFIMTFSTIISSLASLFLKNNGTTTASGYALDARYGKTLYDLLASKMAVENSWASGIDVNTYNVPGSYLIGQNPTHGPIKFNSTDPEYNFVLLVIGSSPQFLLQVAFTNHWTVYFRRYASNAWTNWRTLSSTPNYASSKELFGGNLTITNARVFNGTFEEDGFLQTSIKTTTVAGNPYMKIQLGNAVVFEMKNYGLYKREETGSDIVVTGKNIIRYSPMFKVNEGLSYSITVQDDVAGAQNKTAYSIKLFGVN